MRSLKEIRAEIEALPVVYVDGLPGRMVSESLQREFLEACEREGVGTSAPGRAPEPLRLAREAMRLLHR